MSRSCMASAPRRALCAARCGWRIRRMTSGLSNPTVFSLCVSLMWAGRRCSAAWLLGRHRRRRSALARGGDRGPRVRHTVCRRYNPCDARPPGREHRRGRRGPRNCDTCRCRWLSVNAYSCNPITAIGWQVAEVPGVPKPTTAAAFDGPSRGSRSSAGHARVDVGRLVAGQPMLRSPPCAFSESTQPAKQLAINADAPPQSGLSPKRRSPQVEATRGDVCNPEAQSCLVAQAGRFVIRTGTGRRALRTDLPTPPESPSPRTGL